MTAFIGEIHPLAAEWPMMPDDELDALAESIKAHGLRQPIVTTPDGVLIDGRNRLEACHRARVSPTFTTHRDLIDDAAIEDYIADANAERRNVSTGQKAMSRARALVRVGKRTNGRWARGTVTANGRASNSEEAAWIKSMKLAGLVMDWRPDLAGTVIGGGITLNEAATLSQEARDADLHAKEAERRRQERRDDLAAARPDLAALVDAGKLPLEEAYVIRDADRAKEESAVRERRRRAEKFSTDVCLSIKCLEPLHQFPDRREQVESELDFAILADPVTADDIDHAIESLRLIAAVLRDKETSK